MGGSLRVEAGLATRGALWRRALRLAAPSAAELPMRGRRARAYDPRPSARRLSTRDAPQSRAYRPPRPTSPIRFLLRSHMGPDMLELGL